MRLTLELASLALCSLVLQSANGQGAEKILWELPGAIENETARLGLSLEPSLEGGLRKWWGNVWFGEFERMIEHDWIASGFELSQELTHSINRAMHSILHKHLSSKPCTSLPVNISLHAWRYNQDELNSCLNMMSEHGASCTLHCQNLPRLSTTLTCSKTDMGWQLLGSPPEGQCRWALDTEVVNTTGGLVRGLVRPLPWKQGNGSVSIDHSRTFWGIRYANCPKRFAMSEPLSVRWDGVQVTDYWDVNRNDSLRMHCADGMPGNGFHGSEDCLFLDVYVPPLASFSAPKPVLVWIFAAGFIFGDAWQNGHLDAARLALRQDAVVVMISSRSAALGHWAHPALSREYGDGSAGNLGERDQRQALRWVQDNIRSFGGDPNRVTVAGHSSGAFDTFFHVLSPESQSLIHGAILESATLDAGWYWQVKEQAFRFYGELGEAMGCPWDQGSGEQIDCLRALPLDAFPNFVAKQQKVLLRRMKEQSDIDGTNMWSVLKALFGVFAGSFEGAGLERGDSSILANPLWPLLCFGIVIDGANAGLPAAPRQLYENGNSAPIPVYLNFESDEGSMFAMIAAILFPWEKRLSVTHTAIDSIMNWAFGGNASFNDLLDKVYPGSWLQPSLFRLVHAITDSVFKCSNLRFARSVTQQRPGTVYLAEHTFVEAKSTNVISALATHDAQWFLGAHHALPTSQLFGFMYSFTGNSSSWDSRTQKDHMIVNCHYALMLHCRDPGAMPGRAGCLPEKTIPRACQGLSGHEVRPFRAFEASGTRNQLHPQHHAQIIPTPEEREICSFWDSAPPMSFSNNSCRECVHASSTLGATMIV